MSYQPGTTHKATDAYRNLVQLDFRPLLLGESSEPSVINQLEGGEGKGLGLFSEPRYRVEECPQFFTAGREFDGRRIKAGERAVKPTHDSDGFISPDEDKFWEGSE